MTSTPTRDQIDRMTDDARLELRGWIKVERRVALERKEEAEKAQRRLEAELSAKRYEIEAAQARVNELDLLVQRLDRPRLDRPRAEADAGGPR